MPGNSSFFKKEAFAKVRLDLSVLGVLGGDEDKQQVDMGFDLDIPYELLGVFVRHIDTAQPVTRVPLFGIAHFDLTTESGRAAGIPPGSLAFRVLPLGVVGTDHVGYASFDLWPLRSEEVVVALREALDQAGLLAQGKPRLTIAVSQLHVMPFKDPAIVFDALREGDLGPSFACLRIDLDEGMLRDRPLWPAMPSMQTPGILDWRLSPGSFSMSGALLIGEDGCETLLPSNLSTRMVRFVQLIRTLSRVDIKFDDRSVREIPGISGAKQATLGWRVIYSTEWYPLGHSLGQIAYSLPLAPGEKVAVSIVDWTRRDAAVRNEQTKEAEDLQHATLRDRTLTEAVHMVVQESQSGSSFEAGGALSAGAGIPIGPVSLGVGGAFAAGGASAESRGMRDVVGDTTQHITDAFHQASSAMRELNSTVVVQSTQAETAQARTRIVANYNHSHALTILYYEVLQHHRLLTRPSRVRPVIFVQVSLGDFDYETILRYEQVIRRALLDPRVADCIDVVRRRDCLELNLERTKQKLKDQGDPTVTENLARVTVSLRNGPRVVILASATMRIVWKSNTLTTLDVVDPNLMTEINGVKYKEQLHLNTPPIQSNTDFVFDLTPEMQVRWNDIFAIELSVNAYGERTGPVDWDISNIRIETTGTPGRWVMVDEKTPTLVTLGQTHRFGVAPFKMQVKTVDDLLLDEELCCLHRLLEHLNDNKPYYWRAIWMSLGVWEREQLFSHLALNGVRLLDLVDSQLLDVIGDQMVFPAASGTDQMLGKAFGIERFKVPQFNEYVEQLLTTPERGVFAEAKLGHCNASEVIDNTRFWDWKLSPIPDNTPPIGTANLDSRYQDPTKGLTPTNFPPAMVNIVTPSAMPDPTGFSTAASVLNALGAFRDMSGLQQVTQLLQTLSNNATELAKQGLQNAAKPGGGGAGPGGQSAGNSASGEGKGTSVGGGGTTGGQTDGGSSGANTGGGGGDGTNTGGGTTGGNIGGGTGGNTGGGGGTNTPQVPKPTRTPQQSPKQKSLDFIFSYDTRTVMRGQWTVYLEESGGRAIASDGKMIDMALGASGRGIGDKIGIYNVPADFGTVRDVTVRIVGSSQGTPGYLSTPQMDVEFKPWSTQDAFVVVVAKEDFSKTQTFQVIQPTEDFKMTITRKTSGTESTVTATSQTAGVKVGVESVTEVGGNVGVANGKESVKIAAEGTYGLTQGETKTSEEGQEKTYTTDVTGRKVKTEPPKIVPVGK